VALMMGASMWRGDFIVSRQNCHGDTGGGIISVYASVI